MVDVRRWAVVSGGVALLVSLPAIVAAVPARDGGLSAADLLARVRASTSIAYSGYAESRGTLGLPVTRQVADLADLLGGTTRLRVWWSGPQRWRVDALDPAAERDTYADKDGFVEWDSDEQRVRRVLGDAPLRLPRTSDLLPPEVGRRLLSEARADEVARIPADRVAGRSAPGLRLHPRDPDSTVDHVDVWADERTGLPLRVAVHGGRTGTAALDTAFLDLRIGRPPASVLRFTAPDGARQDTVVTPDVVAAVDSYAPYALPDRLGGLTHRLLGEGLGGLGTYGRGVTLLSAVPLPGGTARSLRDRLEKTPGSTKDDDGTLTFSAGPLRLLLTDVEGQSWALGGTVTTRVLRRAADDLRAHPPGPR